MTRPLPPDSDAESLLRALLENVPGAIYRCLIDRDWTMLRIGAEIESISGYPPSDFIGSAKRPFASILHPDDRGPVDRDIRTALAAERGFALEYRVLHADGRIRWVLERGVKTVDREGREWLDGIIFDITERHEAEDLRLQQEIERARIAQLEASRSRILAAADDARRTIERDLHEGAQQRLVAASVRLRAAEKAAEQGRDATTLLREARDELDAGIDELRELARGIHPALLTHRGLSPAVAALAARCTTPVDVDDGLGERLAPGAEAALYYTVSEALTNVDRHAGASRATVRLRRTADTAEVEVSDDGCGCVAPTRGSGLRGLEDRLSAIGGALELDGRPGEGTRLRAWVPLGTPG